MIKSEIFDFMLLVYTDIDRQERFTGRLNEVSVFIDVGGSVWFLLFVSHLYVFDAWCISSESVWS